MKKTLLIATAVTAAVFFVLAAFPSWADGLPKSTADAVPITGLKISDCLGILAGLTQLDTGGNRHIIAEGKPDEKIETLRFKLPGKTRDAMSHDLFVLGQVQQEVNAANRRTQLDLMGDSQEPLKPGSKQNMIFDQRMTEYTARPCTVQLDHINDADLDLEHNDISASTLSLLTKIRDK
jgi:hypothetical protein